jgi:hypothetical protein
MIPSTSRIAAALVVAVVAAAPAARAQNLLPNGSFPELFMLEGWPQLESATWSAIDADEVANSGSLRVANAADVSAKGANSDCFPAEGDTLYRIAASVLWLDAESSADGDVQVRLSFYASSNCTGGVFAKGGLQTVAADSWQRVQALVVSPPGTLSGQASLWNWRDGSSGTFVSYFDDAEVVSLPEPAGSALAMGVLAALAAIKRQGRP